MSQKKENTGFVCANCNEEILPLSNGSFRNHCPHCLHSLHVDEEPGDRKSQCRGLMEPIGYRYKSGKGYQIAHECKNCGKVQMNKVAELTIQPDNVEKMIVLRVLKKKLIARCCFMGYENSIYWVTELQKVFYLLMVDSITGWSK